MNISGTATFRTLGHTGLRVSPLALGAMTFGWGSDKNSSRQLFEPSSNSVRLFLEVSALRGSFSIGKCSMELRENDLECLAKTGVNTPPMAKMTVTGEPGAMPSESV
jgi:hypothetical protein